LQGGSLAIVCNWWERHLAAKSRLEALPQFVAAHAKGDWVMIPETGLTDEATARWVEKARAFVKSLPAK
jgi:hypothetical protein